MRDVANFMHVVNCIVDDVVDGKPVRHMVETSVGRVIVNQIIPDEVGFFNDIISKKHFVVLFLMLSRL